MEDNDWVCIAAAIFAPRQKSVAGPRGKFKHKVSNKIGIEMADSLVQASPRTM